jgi:hypothetical protein
VKIKYMGTSDNRVLEKGEDFGGQLAEPISQRVAWTVANNHLVDSEEAGLSDEAVELLLGLEGTVYGEADLVEPDESTAKSIKEFKDVTDLKVIPPSLHQQTYLGLKGQKNKDAVEASEADDVEQTDGEAKTEARGKKVRSTSGGAGGGGGAVPVGGATDGVGGDTGGVATTGATGGTTGTT